MLRDSRGDRESIEEMLHHDHYTPRELADLTGINIDAILRCAREGELRAFVVDHHVLSLRREDVVDWFVHRR